MSRQCQRADDTENMRLVFPAAFFICFWEEIISQLCLSSFFSSSSLLVFGYFGGKNCHCKSIVMFEDLNKMEVNHNQWKKCFFHLRPRDLSSLSWRFSYRPGAPPPVWASWRRWRWSSRFSQRRCSCRRPRPPPWRWRGRPSSGRRSAERRAAGSLAGCPPPRRTASLAGEFRRKQSKSSLFTWKSLLGGFDVGSTVYCIKLSLQLLSTAMLTVSELPRNQNIRLLILLYAACFLKVFLLTWMSPCPISSQICGLSRGLQTQG